MATPESATEMTPLEYLKQADQEMAAGNGQLAAGFLWKATESALLELAKGRSIKLVLGIEDLTDLAIALEADGSVDKYHYRSAAVTAKMLREHAEEEIYEDYELEVAYKVTRDFVIRCQGELE